MKDVTQLIGKKVKFLLRDIKGTRIDAYTIYGVVVEANFRNEFIKVKWSNGEVFSIHYNSPCILNKKELHNNLGGK